MRTIEQFRDRLLEDLRRALEHPAMFGGNAGGVEQYFRNVLDDLSFIDEREKELAALQETLLTGSYGVNGQFFYQALFELDYINEVTSVYAQAAYVLGFFQPSRLLSKSELVDLRQSIDHVFLSNDHTLKEVEANFGPTSIEIGCRHTWVGCYACTDRNENWVFFDFFRQLPRTDPSTSVWFESPRLRNVRLDRNKMLLVPFGASLAKPVLRPEP
jgi:hypothetical protein